MIVDDDWFFMILPYSGVGDIHLRFPPLTIRRRHLLALLLLQSFRQNWGDKEPKEKEKDKVMDKQIASSVHFPTHIRTWWISLHRNQSS